MLATAKDITELIPQKHPMVMIDALIECDQNRTITGFSVKDDNIFADNEHFTEPGLIENMAQTAAVRNGWLAKEQKGQDMQAAIGFIGAIKNFKLYFLPRVPCRLITTIELTGEYLNALAVKGKVLESGKIAAECELKIFTKEEKQ